MWLNCPTFIMARRDKRKKSCTFSFSYLLSPALWVSSLSSSSYIITLFINNIFCWCCGFTRIVDPCRGALIGEAFVCSRLMFIISSQMMITYDISYFFAWSLSLVLSNVRLSQTSLVFKEKTRIADLVNCGTLFWKVVHKKRSNCSKKYRAQKDCKPQ